MTEDRMTPDPAMAVEQVDREAAAACREAYSGRAGSLSAAKYRSGADDDGVFVQAFARHRLAATRDIAMPEGEDENEELAKAIVARWCEAWRWPDLEEGVSEHSLAVAAAKAGIAYGRMLRAALPAVRSGWRGIESAPKNQVLDLWSVFDNGGTKTGERLVNCRWTTSVAYGTGWHDCWGNKIEWSADDGCSRYVTHWMPIPAAPSDAGEGRS